MIAQNLKDVQARMAAAAESVGRKPASVKLIAVSKTKPLDMVREAHVAGQLAFGENRPQELAEKAAEMPEMHWHFIGNLQRNKVKYIIDVVTLIHSVDSERLLEEIDKRARNADRVIDCLFQINISNEDQKGGFEEAEAKTLLRRMAEFPNVRIIGVMGMAEFTADKVMIRKQFKRLAAAFEEFRELETKQVKMQELSMGMSGDFEIAIEEGATLVRVGSAIFGGR